MTAAPRRTGVLVMAYGTPDGPDDIEAYYTHIRHGRPPEPDALAELRGRYEAIGGMPLLGITRAQADGIAAALESARPGEFTVTIGQKHSAPFIEDGAAELLRRGVVRIVGIVLAPHYSTMSVAEYSRRAREAAADTGIPVDVVSSWHAEPGYVSFLERAVDDALATLPEDRRGSVELVVTAHSLPVSILDRADPYPEQLEDTRRRLAGRPGFAGTSLAWQSAGRTAAEWLGPDVTEVIPELRDRGRTAVVVCAAGFVADHLEVLYDLDIEASEDADAAGLAFARTAMPNADRAFVETVAGVVRRESERAAVAGSNEGRRR